MAETFPGRRVPDGTPAWEYEPGDYGRWGDGWWCQVPEPTVGGAAALTGPHVAKPWTVVEHEDGTITVSPSIFDRPPEGWHGWLERGVWRTA